jgi:hypothetical protein
VKALLVTEFAIHSQSVHQQRDRANMTGDLRSGEILIASAASTNYPEKRQHGEIMAFPSGASTRFLPFRQVSDIHRTNGHLYSDVSECLRCRDFKIDFSERRKESSGRVALLLNAHIQGRLR